MEADRIMKEVHRIAYNVMSLNIDYCKNNIVHEIQLHKLQLQTLRINIIFNKKFTHFFSFNNSIKLQIYKNSKPIKFEQYLYSKPKMKMTIFGTVFCFLM